ncbi:HVO_2523 family zinc finger protein [Halorussus salinus]|uniref:HVO_2523 family zinc finger protein n=1 Tax=Halorussus salinus TaxID=1364935 RepID=UPI001092FDCC
MSDSAERGDESERGRGDGDDGSGEQGGRPCPICETPMYSRHCKYVCPQHGIIMDCADTFY